MHEDDSTPMAAVNILYDVGARDETSEKTGFAHLFEHLMFGGSANIPDFDGPLQNAGGQSNAFTSSDITNYYDIVPAHNLETALWLESDRMLQLDFSQQSLDVQKKVVSEEYKQRYLNQPYGDAWHELLKITYKDHPYQWPVIGKNLQHIENFELEDVKAFFEKYYLPNNAIITIAGGVKTSEVVSQVKKWFGEIPSGQVPTRQLPIEKANSGMQLKEVSAKVPQDALYFAFKMTDNKDPRFFACDFMSDVLSGGSSARLYQSLVKEKELFSNIGAYYTGTRDKGFLLVEGKVQKNIELKEAEAAVWSELNALSAQPVTETEVQTMKNKIESSIEFSQDKLLNRAKDISYFALIEQENLINGEAEAYNAVSADDLQSIASEFITEENASILHYHAN